MNARIKLPAQEWLGYDPERGNLHGYTFEQMREFAELIVAECANFVEDKFDFVGEEIIVKEKMLEHFGVES